MIIKKIASDVREAMRGDFDPKSKPKQFFAGAFDAYPGSGGHITQEGVNNPNVLAMFNGSFK